MVLGVDGPHAEHALDQPWDLLLGGGDVAEQFQRLLRFPGRRRLRAGCDRLLRVRQEPGIKRLSRRCQGKLRPAAGEPLCQAAALDQIHAEVLPAVVGADFVDRHDVWVIELGRSGGFLAKALHLN